MDRKSLNILPSIVIEHLKSSSAEAWKIREESSFSSLLGKYSENEIVNAFVYLKSHGIPPFGEVTREPLRFLFENQNLVDAFNVGVKKPDSKPITRNQIERELS